MSIGQPAAPIESSKEQVLQSVIEEVHRYEVEEERERQSDRRDSNVSTVIVLVLLFAAVCALVVSLATR